MMRQERGFRDPFRNHLVGVLSNVGLRQDRDPGEIVKTLDIAACYA
jgi:hypothetical protein